ncbi:TAXI family TRAP transporter solute-binding subunit [Amorphus orientalis]|uniref:TRAP transporter TAXI family solute receptor n=1 Tax=Amorphus orientalis TaxID=649198 RepID=A0AAE4ATJ2_9HYPH|nr:TAXI family TRAP transporter solute-binding subunit [Amorphus orientalis]MDQ0315044.1 TRAP transporter TAXI family solute receptor [Amorphus orientalis]
MKAIFGFAAAALAAGAIAATPVLAETVSISTLPPGAINNVQAQAIAKVVQEHSDLQMRVVTFNSPGAIMGSTQAGQTDFSFISTDETGAAFEGSPPYDGKAMKDLRVAATIFPFKVGLVVRNDSDIKSVEDLQGKRIPTGWQGFQQGLYLFDGLLATAGTTLDELAAEGEAVPTANLLRGADDLKADRIDVTMFAVGAPKMAELDSAIPGGIRFLSLTDTPETAKAMADVRPEYHMAVQKPAPHLAGIHGDTTLMQYAMVVVANKNVSDDTVYELVKAIYENKPALVAGHPSFNAMTQEGLATTQPRVEYHPGAIKFYKEAGIWQGD